jgi:DNA modification methylase
LENGGGEVLFDDGMTRLYHGDANEVIPTIGKIFDAVIFDPPRLGSITMSTIELARVLVPYVDGWIVHMAGGKQWDFWSMPNVPYRMPKLLLPDYNDNEYLVFVHPSGFTEGSLNAPNLREGIEPYAPPDWCKVARHPELYRWLYSFIVPIKDALILDPCCGSGNSLIAAREMGIRSIGIEWKENIARHIQERLNGSSAYRPN